MQATRRQPDKTTSKTRLHARWNGMSMHSACSEAQQGLPHNMRSPQHGNMLDRLTLVVGACPVTIEQSLEEHRLPYTKCSVVPKKTARLSVRAQDQVFLVLQHTRVLCFLSRCPTTLCCCAHSASRHPQNQAQHACNSDCGTPRYLHSRCSQPCPWLDAPTYAEMPQGTAASQEAFGLAHHITHILLLTFWHPHGGGAPAAVCTWTEAATDQDFKTGKSTCNASVYVSVAGTGVPRAVLAFAKAQQT
jgi:hypothetical protein